MWTTKSAVVILGAILFNQPVLAQRVAGQERFVSGVVENLDGERLANAKFRLTNLGSGITSENGQFTVFIPSRVQPGDPLEISVGEEWFVVKPFDGLGFIPPSFTELVHVRVARKGDPRLLADPKIIKELVVSVTSILGSDLGQTADQDQFLAEKARQMGFSVNQAKAAIDSWSKSVQRPYEKGLAALYSRAYADASAYLQQSPQVADDDDQLEGYLCLASAQYLLGRYSEAVVALQAARRIRPENPGVLRRLGVALRLQGQYEQAREASELALEIYERALGPDHLEVAQQLSNIAVVYQEQVMYSEAATRLERAISVAEKIPGADLVLATALNNLGVNYGAQGRDLEAATLYERVLAIDQRVSEMKDSFVATVLNNLGVVYFDLGRYKEAEPLYRRALTIDEKIHGPEHPQVAVILNNLAVLYSKQGRFTDAERLDKRAILIAQKSLGPTHKQVATYLSSLGTDYLDEGRYSEAEPLLKQALEIEEKVLGPEHPKVATALNNLAALYDHWDRYAEAESLYRRAIAIDQKVLGEKHPSVALNLHNLAMVYINEGKPEEALPLLEDSLTIFEKAFGPDHPDVAMDLDDLAIALRALGRAEEADADQARATTIRKTRSDKRPK
jgi:tetratricopeptide (TPR) repeat protein